MLKKFLGGKMTLKKIQYSMFILFMLATGVLTLLTIDLSKQKLESRAAIQVLTREVSLMDKKLPLLKSIKEKLTETNSRRIFLN